ncbi:Urinary protein 1-like precursor [Rattus norvegicus]|uniref:Urinary protein 4 n=1 Tax=Rattus norvegicus TaxID=10116 RepID=D3ZIF6_RAT|nr:Urinary protein 1-like precursor [Rattus norvegicus]AEZ68749.1 urinary protein 4 [Rattus norvegicus]|eukprot:NP_001244024.1 uncharacterized protein LOC100360095 precursor [Rattus norvegicus]
MGKHILLLLLGLTLLVSSLQALVCFECGNLNSMGICNFRTAVCYAHPGEVCASVLTYKDGKFVYGNQSCAECSGRTVEHGSLIVSTNCCSATSFCNIVRP